MKNLIFIAAILFASCQKEQILSQKLKSAIVEVNMTVVNGEPMKGTGFMQTKHHFISIERIANGLKFIPLEGCDQSIDWCKNNNILYGTNVKNYVVYDESIINCNWMVKKWYVRKCITSWAKQGGGMRQCNRSLQPKKSEEKPTFVQNFERNINKY